jgi:hypothetical protein
MRDICRPLARVGVAVAALALAGCANLPVEDYAAAAPAGYYSPNDGYYVPDDYYWPGWEHHHDPLHFDHGDLPIAYVCDGHFNGESGAHAEFGGRQGAFGGSQDGR